MGRQGLSSPHAAGAVSISRPRSVCETSRYRRGSDRYRKPVLGSDASAGVDLIERGQHLIGHMGKQIPLCADLLELLGESQIIEMHRRLRTEKGALDKIKIGAAAGRDRALAPARVA